MGSWGPLAHVDLWSELWEEWLLLGDSKMSSRQSRRHSPDGTCLTGGSKKKLLMFQAQVLHIVHPLIISTENLALCRSKLISGSSAFWAGTDPPMEFTLVNNISQTGFESTGAPQWHPSMGLAKRGWPSCAHVVMRKGISLSDQGSIEAAPTCL